MRSKPTQGSNQLIVANCTSQSGQWPPPANPASSWPVGNCAIYCSPRPTESGRRRCPLASPPAHHAFVAKGDGKSKMGRESGSQEMTKNVFIVEGLPGVGKSYFCEILQQEIRDKTGNTEILFFEERDTDHPFHCSEDDVTDDIWSIDYRDFFRLVEVKCQEVFSEK